MKQMMITPAGLLRFEEELDRLKTAGRQEIADRLRLALSTDSDASASADYFAAREEQARHARRNRLSLRRTGSYPACALTESASWQPPATRVSSKRRTAPRRE